MRLFAYLFGPWQRRMNASRRFRRLYYVFLGLFCVGAGTAVGLIRSFQEASGWTKVLATVIRAGTYPIDPNDVDNSSDTVSLLRFTLPGQTKPVQRLASIPWWYREHTSHSQLFVWVRGSVISSTDQTSLHWIILGWIALGIVLWIFALFTGSLLYEGIQSYERRTDVLKRRRRQAIRRDRNRSEVSTLEGLIAFCRKHGRTKVSLKEAAKITNCRSGVIRFRDAHFPKRSWVRLSELIPFLDGTTTLDTYNRRYVAQVAIGVLKRLGVLKRTFAHTAPIPT